MGGYPVFSSFFNGIFTKNPSSYWGTLGHPTCRPPWSQSSGVHELFRSERFREVRDVDSEVGMGRKLENRRIFLHRLRVFFFFFVYVFIVLFISLPIWCVYIYTIWLYNTHWNVYIYILYMKMYMYIVKYSNNPRLLWYRIDYYVMILPCEWGQWWPYVHITIWINNGLYSPNIW